VVAFTGAGRSHGSHLQVLAAARSELGMGRYNDAVGHRYMIEACNTMAKYRIVDRRTKHPTPC